MPEETPVDSGPILQRRKPPVDAEMDITPMIDITFLLLIFFLVASIPDPQTAVELPSAVSGLGVSKRDAVIVTIADGGDGSGEIYLADGKIGAPLPDDPDAQKEALLQYVEAGFAEGKTKLLIKGAGDLKSRVVHRVSSVLAEVEGADLRLHWAVLEADE